MGDEARFSEKWDFRRKENSFNDSSSDDPDSNPNHDPIIHNPNLVQHSNQIKDGMRDVVKEQPVKTRKRRSKKDETKPEKPKQRRGRKPKAVCVEENTKKEETIMDGVGTFMQTLVDDLTASRESLMNWMKSELYGSLNPNVPSRPPLTKRAVGSVAAQKPVKRRRTKKQIEEENMKKREEEEKKKNAEVSNPGKTGQEIITPKEKSLEITESNGDFDCNAGALEMFLKSGQSDLGRNYFQQQDQEGLVAQTEMENLKNETVKSQKSIVLAIQAPNLSKKRKKESEANTYKNKSVMVESIGPEKQKDHYAVTPYVPQQYSSSSLQSYPVASSMYPNPPSSSMLQNFPVPSPLFSSPSQGINSLTGNTNFQMRQPVAQSPNLSEFQTGVTGRQQFGNPLCENNGYLSGFPPAFQPNLVAGGYNFPAQVNPAPSLQQRDNNNMFGGLTMANGAIRYSGNRFPEAEHRNSYNGLSDYRTSSGR